MTKRGANALAKLMKMQDGRANDRPPAAATQVWSMTGNQAIAQAVRQIEYGTVAAFPITPSTELAQDIAAMVADGEIRTDFIAVESEHSAISTIQAAAAAGARVFTATSSAGLALMHEVLHYYAGSRLPGVIAVVNRSIGAPLNILCDHSTIMAQRDTGWLQLFASNVQEAYHFHLLAPRWSEACALPIMVSIDGFELSHITERLQLLPDEVVKNFVGSWEPRYPLATDDDLVVTYPGIAGSDYYSEIKEGQMDAMRRAGRLFDGISAELAAVTGTRLDVIDEYDLEDAEMVLVAIGSATGTIRDKVEDLRARGVKAGLLTVKMFRPFPRERIKAALSGKRIVGVMERVPVLGANIGPLTMEVTQSLYDLPEALRPRIVNFVYGLGGRAVSMDTIGKALNILDVNQRMSANGDCHRVYHLDVRDARKDALLLPDQVDDRFYQPVAKKSLDIRLFARGGEGIKTASKTLASAVIEAGGRFAQGFSVYGAERSGAPTQGYVRIGDNALNERAPIVHSDIDVFVNPGLLDKHAIEGLADDGIILVNSPLSPGELRAQAGLKGRTIYTVDGYGIAQEEIGDRRRNSIAVLAALVGITGSVLDIHDFLSNLDKLPFERKIIDGNKRAVARAYFEWQAEQELES